jgi:hypothetical protein
LISKDETYIRKNRENILRMIIIGLEKKDNFIVASSLELLKSSLTFIKMAKNSLELKTILNLVFSQINHFDFNIRKYILDFFSDFAIFYYDSLENYISEIVMVISILFIFFFFYFHFKFLFFFVN